MSAYGDRDSPGTVQLMNRRALLTQTLIARSRVSANRIDYYEEADESIFQEIRCGVVFIIALWSGVSWQAYAKLTEVLSRLDPNGEVQLVVVNTDGLADPPDNVHFLGRRSGSGETAWVKDGQILSTSGWGYNPDSFELNTAGLLADCSK